MTCKDIFPGLSRSWNFQAKKSRTFQEAWEPWMQHSKPTTCKIIGFIKTSTKWKAAVSYTFITFNLEVVSRQVNKNCRAGLHSTTICSNMTVTMHMKIWPFSWALKILVSTWQQNSTKLPRNHRYLRSDWILTTRTKTQNESLQNTSSTCYFLAQHICIYSC